MGELLHSLIISDDFKAILGIDGRVDVLSYYISYHGYVYHRAILPEAAVFETVI
jgi:hypothetical protein